MTDNKEAEPDVVQHQQSDVVNGESSSEPASPGVSPGSPTGKSENYFSRKFGNILRSSKR